MQTRFLFYPTLLIWFQQLKEVFIVFNTSLLGKFILMIHLEARYSGEGTVFKRPKWKHEVSGVSPSKFVKFWFKFMSFNRKFTPPLACKILHFVWNFITVWDSPLGISFLLLPSICKAIFYVIDTMSKLPLSQDTFFLL